MSLFTAIASATATAFALDYITHAEWGPPLIVIRRDALVIAGFVTLAMIIKALLQRKRKRDSRVAARRAVEWSSARDQFRPNQARPPTACRTDFLKPLAVACCLTSSLSRPLRGYIGGDFAYGDLVDPKTFELKLLKEIRKRTAASSSRRDISGKATAFNTHAHRLLAERFASAARRIGRLAGSHYEEPQLFRLHVMGKSRLIRSPAGRI